MERGDQISEHEVRIYEAAKTDGGWLTARELAVKADVADRTARAHAAAFGISGVLQVSKMFGGYRYRIATDLPPSGQEYVARLEAAKRILGR